MFSLCLVLVVVFVSMVESRLENQQRITPPMGVSPQMQGAMGGSFFIENARDVLDHVPEAHPVSRNLRLVS